MENIFIKGSRDNNITSNIISGLGLHKGVEITISQVIYYYYYYTVILKYKNKF
jgi:hypothetical protein